MERARVAVVTGGANGLGRAAALRLAEDGRTIVIWDRDADAAKRTIAELNSRDARAMTLDVDVASPESLEAAYSATVDFLGPVDILVNAAAIIGVDASVLETPLHEWDRVLAVNLTGTYLASRMVVFGMAERGWGRIVNFTSGARHGTPALIPYAVSKAGVLALTRVLALEWAPAGITVNCIIPGVFATEMNRPMLDDPERSAGVVAKVPLGRWGEPAEVAGMALYLASDAASYVTGAALTVDGGWSVH